MSENKRFVFNDESVKNSYGFYILSSGIDTRRFSQNPVCLADHWNWTGSVLGTWEDVQAGNGTLSGTPKFDTKSYEELVRQVESGTLKGCSMGILFDEADFTKNENGDLILTKCELMEVSIVAVPSNANSIALYHKNGNRMTEPEVKTLCLSLGSPQEAPINNPINNNNSIMKKIQLSLMAFAALGFAQTTQNVEEPELDKAILTMKNEYDKNALELEKVKKELQAYQEADQLKKSQEIETMVTLAVQEGRITADKKQTFIDLAAQNLELAKSTLETFPKKIDLSAGVTTPVGGEPMTEEKFQTLSEEQRLAWKNANPDVYKKLFA